MKTIAAVSGKIAAILEKIIRVIAIVILVVLVCTVFFQVARRIITGKSIIQIEEFSIVMASWLAFTTVPYAVRRKVHVKIDVFTEKLPYYPRHILNLIIQAVLFAAVVILVQAGWQLGLKKQKVPMTVLPMRQDIWYMSFPIGMAFTCLFLLDNIIQEIAALVKGPSEEDKAVKEA